jgi:hypothetical protein
MTARFGHRTETSLQVTQWLNPVDQRLSVPRRLDVSTPSVVADAIAHVKGAWTEVFASTSADASLVFVSISNSVSTTARQSLFDIGIGAAGSEQTIVANAMAGATNNNGVGGVRSDFIYLINIPAGSRVAFRMQSVVAGATATFYTTLLNNNFKSPSALVTFGANTATSRGTNMPTDDTYVELVASTTEEFQGLVGVPLIATNNTSTENTTMTVAVGPAGSEVELGTFSVRSVNTEAGGYEWRQTPFVYYGRIPAGSRIAAKQNIGRTWRDIIVHGIPAT